MAENGRIKEIPKVIDDYRRIMSASRKETSVSVTTAEVVLPLL